MESTKKRISLRLPAKAGIWNIISGVVARGVGVVGTPLFTRLLTPAEYGLYPLYTTWLSVIAAVAAAGLTGSAMYRGFQRYAHKKEEFASAATGLGLSGALLLLIIGIPLAPLISQISGLGYSVLLALIGEIALSTVTSVRSSLLRYEYKYKALALINLFSALSTPLFSVAVLFFTPYRAEARIIGSLTASAIVALPALLKASGGARLFDKEIWGYLLRVNLPLIPHYLSSSLILRASEMVVGRVHGEAALAKYSVGISVGLALTFLSNALSQATSPWILRRIAAGEDDRVRELMMPTLGALMCISLLLLAAAPEILAIITPPEYKDALPTVYPLAVSVSAMMLTSAIVAAEAYYERSARSSLPSVLTALLSLGAALIILPKSDFRFSALFTLLSYLALATLSHISFKQISGKSVVDGRKCVLLFALFIIYAAVMFIFRGVLMSRVLLAVPIIPLLLGFGKRVLSQIRE